MFLKNITYSSLFLSLGFLYITEINKEATIATLIIGIFFGLQLIINRKKKTNHGVNVKNLNDSNTIIKKISVYLVYFFLIIITQNVTLNFEVISWDIPSYLVASQEINMGYLPLETQWESKGPLFFYMYNIVSNIVNNSYILFRLANDILLLIVTIMLFNITLTNSQNFNLSIFTGLFFIVLTSIVWYVSEYSELYSLLFISISYRIFQIENDRYFKFIVGVLLGLSTLINQGTVLFLIPFLITLYFKKEDKFLNITRLLIGFSLPHLIFLYLYFQRDLLDIYLANYIQLPLTYTQSSLSSFYELKVWIRGYYEYDGFLYAVIILTFVYFSKEFFTELFNDRKNILKRFDPEFMGLIVSLGVYFIAGHNYYHHLFYLLFFTSLFVGKVKDKESRNIIFSLIVLSSITIVSTGFNGSINNLSNLDETQNDYPIYQLSKEVKNFVDSDDEILALDYILLLYYLDKPNYSYIVHPSNHYDDAVTETLTHIGKLVPNHISIMIEEEPKVIICNPRQIINGNPQRIDDYNCAISDYKFNYEFIDTEIYRTSFNLEYYKNPYQTINLYIKDD